MKAFGMVERLPSYNFAKHFEVKVLPFSYVFFLTTKCNSKCATCNLWAQSTENEIDTDSWLKAIKSIGNNAAWITVTGGEPFMHPNILPILRTIIRYNKPAVLNMPTNASIPDRIEKTLVPLLKSKKCPNIIINISVDELHEKHDEIRGLPGNFALMEETVARLNRIKTRKLNIGVNIVLSKNNIDRFYEIYNYVKKKLKPDDIIVETAQQRVELGTRTKDLSMKDSKRREILEFMQSESWKDMFAKQGFSLIKNFSRWRYYRYARAPKKRKCNAGILSAQLMPDGRVVTCGTRGMVIGDLKDHNFNFRELWFSNRAKHMRNQLRKRKCSCELANIFYVNQV